MIMKVLQHAILLYNHAKATVGHARAIYEILRQGLTEPQ